MARGRHRWRGPATRSGGTHREWKFEATPPLPPSMGTTLVESSTQIQWTFSPADANLFGFDVADNAGAVLSPNYAAAGWLIRTATSWTESGLTPNTQYTRKVRGWNGELNGGWSATVSAYTLSTPPDASSVVADRASACTGQDVVFSAIGGFGGSKVAYYRYAWDQEPTHTFTGTEPMW